MLTLGLILLGITFSLAAFHYTYMLAALTYDYISEAVEARKIRQFCEDGYAYESFLQDCVDHQHLIMELDLVYGPGNYVRPHAPVYRGSRPGWLRRTWRAIINRSCSAFQAAERQVDKVASVVDRGVNWLSQGQRPLALVGMTVFLMFVVGPASITTAVVHKQHQTAYQNGLVAGRYHEARTNNPFLKDGPLFTKDSLRNAWFAGYTKGANEDQK